MMTPSEVKRLAAYVRRAAPRLGWTALGASLTAALVMPAIAYTSMRMFDAVLVLRSERATAMWMGIEIGLAALITIVSGLKQDAVRLLQAPLALELLTDLARAAAATPLTELDEPERSGLLARARGAAESRAAELVGDLLTLLQGSLSLFICAVVLALFTKLAVLIVVSCVPGVLVEAWSARRQAREKERLTADRRRLDRAIDDLTSDEHRVENAFLGARRLLLERLRRIAARLLRAEDAACGQTRWPLLAAQLLPLAVFYGIYLVLALQVVDGVITFGALTLCLISIDNARQFAQSALLAGRSAADNLAQLRACFAFVDEARAPRPSPPAQPPRAGARGLRCHDVGFRYPGATTWALRHIDLAIAPGELVGIVGGNGSGKSTLVRLLTGLYRPTEGRITLDGRDLRDWHEDELRARLGVVFQDFARYQLSLRENLALPPAVAGDDGRIAEALAHSGVDRFIAGLPRGLDTELSRAFGDGTELSGGQWQKVALARALVRREAGLLILDEPTSALDPDSDEHVMNWVTRRRGERTVILITHRLSALAAANQIVLLDKGRIPAVGA